MPLYEYGIELREIEDEIVDNDGELTPELEARLNAMTGAFADKAERLACVIRALGSRAKMASVEIDRLRRLGTARSNTAARLKAYLMSCMEQADIPRIETPLFKIAIQASPPSVAFDGDLADLPFSMKRTTTVIDKKAALAADKAGERLPPGVKIEHKHHLSIR